MINFEVHQLFFNLLPLLFRALLWLLYFAHIFHLSVFSEPRKGRHLVRMELLQLSHGHDQARVFNLCLDVGHVLLLVKAVAEAVSVSNEVVQLLVSLSVEL